MGRRPRTAAWLASAAGVALLAGCSGSPSSTATTTTSVPLGTIGPSSASSTAPATVPAPPSAPQPSPSDAADALVRGWENGDRASAASVATAAAVATLFAHPYQGQTMVSRGCTTAFPPVVCSYGPNGGGSGSLYQITLAQASGGWYVSTVSIEG